MKGFKFLLVMMVSLIIFGCGGGSGSGSTTIVGPPPSAPGGGSVTSLSNFVVYQNNTGIVTPINSGSTNQKIASFNLQYNYGWSFNGVVITLGNAALQNVKVMVGSTQIGAVQPGVVVGNQYTFTAATPTAVSANNFLTVDVFADTTSNANATAASLVTLNTVSITIASGMATVTANAVGQSIALYFTGGYVTGTVNAAMDSTTAPAAFVNMGIPNYAVHSARINNGLNKVIGLTQVVYKDFATPNNDRTFINPRLAVGNTIISAASEDNAGMITFNFPQMGVQTYSYIPVTLVMDISGYPNANSGAKHYWQLWSFTYIDPQLGQQNVVSSANGNLLSVYRTTLISSSQSFASPTSLSAGAGSILGVFNFTAGNFDALIKSLSLSQSGTMVGSSTQATLNLYTSDGFSIGSIVLTGNSTSSVNVNWTVLTNQTRSLIIRLSFVTGLLPVSVGTGSYQLTLQGVTWNDGISDVPSLAPGVLPLTGQAITGLSN